MISPSFYIRTDENLVIVEVNQSVQNLFGRSLSRIIQQPLSSFLKPLNINESRYTVNYLNITLDMTTTPIDGGYVFILCDDPEVLANVEEINLTQLALDSSEIGVWSYDPKTKEFQCSQTFKKLIGLPITAKLSLERLLAIVYKDDRDLFPLFFENHIHFQMPLQFEFRTKRSQEEKWFSLKGQFVSNNKSNCIVGTIEDSTSEKQMVIALNEANESKKLAIDAGKIGTWNAVLENGVWLWNWDQQANSIFKMNYEDIGNLDKWVERLHPDDKEQVTCEIQHSLATGEEFISYHRSNLPDGETIYVFAQGRVGKNMLGQICRVDGVCIDQTHVYKAQQELKALNLELENRVKQRTEDLNSALTKAEKASQIKSNFLAMMSHELRTPLNGIIGSLDLLSNAKLSFEDLDLVKTANISANNLITILNDVLDINKIEAGKLEIEHTLFDISEVFHQVAITFAAKAKEKNIQLNVYEKNILEKQVIGDENRLRQILLNLVGNAIKFTGNDSEKDHFINMNISFKTINEYQEMCTVSVIDSGIGIEEHVIGKLFTPFTQAEKSTTRQYGGTGLGLSICGKLVDLMGGEITVSSKFGKGSTFEVKIPFWTDNNSQIGKLNKPIQLLIAGQRHPDIRHFESILNSITEPVVIVLSSDENGLNSLEYDIETYLIIEDENELIRLEDFIRRFTSIHFYTLAKLHKAIELKLPQMCINNLQPITSFSLRERLIEAVDDFLLDEEDLFSPELFEQCEAEQAFCHHDILLVEDNPFNQKLLKKQLQALGYSCDIADNGEQGIQFWKKHNYRIILTDCHMPKLDGYEMTKMIRSKEAQSDKPNTPIIAVTGATMNDDVDYCKSIGMNDFLSKPVKLVDIKRVMEKWYV